MTDDELADVLRNWRPAGPPSGLRDRVMEPLTLSVWRPAAAVAALLFTVIGLSVASDHLWASVPWPVALSGDDVRHALQRDLGPGAPVDAMVTDALSIVVPEATSLVRQSEEEP